MNNENVVLRVENLRKEYIIDKKDKIEALKDISFSAVTNEIVILMGPSGSGKSTLLNLLAGIENPTYGQIKINGINIENLSDDSKTEFRRDNIGMIFQFFELHQGLTCRETLELKVMINKINQSIIEVDNLLFKVGLGDKIKINVDKLSFGEKQRLAIARALVNSPKIILADEPTGALDIETASRIMQLLRQTAANKNSLLIISTHDFNILQDRDRVLLLEDGKLIKDIPSISKTIFLKEIGVEDFVS